MIALVRLLSLHAFGEESRGGMFLSHEYAIHRYRSGRRSSLLREEQDLFEILFTIDALIESNEQGQRTYKITKQSQLQSDEEFSSFLTTVYQQEVRPALKPGDNLTVTVHLHAPWLQVEKNLHVREDGQFVVEGEHKPTAELRPLIAPMLAQFMQQVQPGDVFSVNFRIQRL